MRRPGMIPCRGNRYEALFHVYNTRVFFSRVLSLFVLSYLIAAPVGIPNLSNHGTAPSHSSRWLKKNQYKILSLYSRSQWSSLVMLSA